MIPCRVIHTELPENLLDRVMRVDEVRDGDPEWRLLRSGNTRRTFKFTPGDGADSWVVKWGCNYTSLRQIKPALRGRDEATVEWEKTETAAERGIPVLRFSLLAAPRLSSFSIQTLLVSRFIDDAVNIIEFINDNYPDEALVEDLLIRLGEGVANIHKNGLLHRDLSLDNILVVPKDGAHEIVFIDWFKMHVAKGKDDHEGFKQDLVAPLSDFVYVGLSERRIRPFLESYAEAMPWFRDDVQVMLDKGRKTRVGVCKRAHRNCIRRSRRLIQYKHHGYKVFQFKSARVDLKELGPAREDSSGSRVVRSKTMLFGEETRLLADWRCANVLKMTGCVGHELAAYGRKVSVPFLKEFLISERDPEAVPVTDVLDGNSEISRRTLLINAGDFLRRLHYLAISVRKVDLSTWSCVPSTGGRLQFSTTDLGGYTRNAKRPQDLFGWAKDLREQGFSTKDLLHFLKGYGDGEIDKELVEALQ